MDELITADAIAADVIAAFFPASGEKPLHFQVLPVGGGLINHTWRVDVAGQAPLLLQKINTTVFPEPQKIQANYRQVFDQVSHSIRLPRPQVTVSQELLYHDNHGRYWRAFDFMSEGRTLTQAVDSESAGAAARCFAQFTAAFKDFDADRLETIIPGFHDLLLRYDQFQFALQNGNAERKAKASRLITRLQERERYCRFYKSANESGQFLRRVMHHDAKIANVLFHQQRTEVLCLVDLDTVMPGLIFSDCGDMIRSMAASAGESSVHFNAIHIRANIYDAIIREYLAPLQAQLTPEEIRYIHFSGIMMIYMQAMRFLTDYLLGDVYYKINYPLQNVDRAENQLVLLERLEEFLEKQYRFIL